MPNLKTTKKVLDFLKQQEQAVTPTTIHKETKTSYNSVLKSIQFLTVEGLITSISNGHIQLVSIKKKGDSNEQNNNV